MRFTETPAGLRVHDWPEVWWIFGVLFVCFGALFILWPLGLIGGTAMVERRARIASLAIGIFAVLIAIWTVTQTPLSRVQVDGVERVIRITRWGLTGRRDISVAFGDVEAADIERRLAGEHGLRYSFRPRVRLKDGAVVLLSQLWARNPRGAERLVGEIKTRIGLPDATG